MNTVLPIQPLIDAALDTVRNHQLRPGVYARWLCASDTCVSAAPNPYGVADAANLLYTMGHFPRGASERECFVHALRSMQDETAGLFYEETHHPVHTTAHCIAALELFDAAPLRPVRDLLPQLDPAALAGYLDELDWYGNPWSSSHRGAGLYVSLVLSGAADRAWEDAYFGWLWDEADPDTGFWRVGLREKNTDQRGLFPHLAGSFHYLFNHEAAHRPLRYPDRMIDTCLAIRREKQYPLPGKNCGFAEIDWVYCLTRALRQCGHRFGEVMDELRDFAAEFVALLNGLDKQQDPSWNDLHSLFGSFCCMAELQQALPGLLSSDRPLKLVLDRRPFI